MCMIKIIYYMNADDRQRAWTHSGIQVSRTNATNHDKQHTLCHTRTCTHMHTAAVLLISTYICKTQNINDLTWTHKQHADSYSTGFLAACNCELKRVQSLMSKTRDNKILCRCRSCNTDKESSRHVMVKLQTTHVFLFPWQIHFCCW